MRRHNFARVAPALLALLLIPAAYMGSYYALLKAGGNITTWNDVRVHGRRTHPAYRMEGDFVRAVFRPAHEVDRRLRPKRWKIRILNFDLGDEE
jgi:hypothetical protein